MVLGMSLKHMGNKIAKLKTSSSANALAVGNDFKHVLENWFFLSRSEVDLRIPSWCPAKSSYVSMGDKVGPVNLNLVLLVDAVNRTL